MVFSSSYFLFLFLPLIIAVYFFTPKKRKNLILLISSLFFYTYGEKALVLVMITSTIIDFKCGLLIEEGKKKLGLRLSLFSNLLTLGFFKYFNFGVDNLKGVFDFFTIGTYYFEVLPTIILPMGISFYVFQTMSYTIDVYYGRVKANRNFIDFATYVTFFPQLVAGPIVRYQDIYKKLLDRTVTPANFAKGIERFIIGLSKKMLIANNCGSLADSIYNSQVVDISTPNAWLGVLAYTLQIYFDFSGYSDMAIGLAKMFGFDIPENFNYPYISRNIREFWRRWHISLSSWFRDYLYIPLGGNQKGEYRNYLNLIIVFFITGLWHGAAWNFIVWGLFHGFFILIERLFLGKLLEKIWNPVRHCYTLSVVLIGWVLFRVDNFTDAIQYYKKLFIYSYGNESVNDYISFFHYNKEVWLALILGCILSLPIYPYVEKKCSRGFFLNFRYILVICLFLISITYVASGSYNPFIYFRF